ncbi:MAG: hypothetical protein D6760_01410 [Deltaproteobacteria bacterium]|nr:MAG: hypothetical protein D6760_01410 [Deltaproteobacteria bacterium]
MARRYTTVFIWDLDKTYLVSHFESLRQLLKVPFEKGEDKVAVPGAVSLIKGLRRSVRRRGRAARVYFVSASPPQIAGAIKEKLALDGIDYDGIAFKNQMRHLISARFAAVREQIGYKLEQLLRHARQFEPGSRLLMFGDDWESDPFVYSLFSDVVEGRIEADRVMRLLELAAVDEHYTSRIERLLPDAFVGLTVDHLFILRQRPVPAGEFEPFGPRLTWVDSYFEAALKLFVMGCLDVAGVLDVAAELHRTPSELAECLRSFERRGGVDRSALGPVRRELVRSGLMAPVSGGPPWRRMAAWWRRRLDMPPKRPRALPLPPYEELAERWSRKGRKEATHHESGANGGRRADDRSG